MNPNAATPASKAVNPVTGPAQPPGFTGLRRWTDIRLAVPFVLIIAGLWMFTHSSGATPTAPAPSAVDQNATVVDTSDLIARSPEPREAPPPPRPTPALTAQPTTAQAATVAAADVSSGTADAPPPPLAAPEPPAPPPPTAAQIARQKRADDDRAALDAPLVAIPVRPPPAPSVSPADTASTAGYWLRRGMNIAAILYTSIDSTVPGVIVAYVADDVYDFTHAVIVIPRGAKLVGSFGGRGVGIAQGQARIPASFDEIQLANRVVALGDEPGIDRTGTSGLGARVDRHTRATFESFAILAGVGLVARANSCTNCEQSGSGNVGSTIVSAGTPLLPQANAIQPTLHVAEGAQIAIMLAHDIRLPAWTADAGADDRLRP